MNWVDLVVMLILGLSVISGLMAGFARVGVSFIATLGGIFTGFWCYGIAGDYVADYVNSRPVANLIGFSLIFCGVMILGTIVGRLLGMFFKWTGLSWFDRLLGAAFGLVRGVVIAVAIVTLLLACSPKPPPHSITNSRVIPHVLGAANVLAAVTPHEIKDAFYEAKDKVTDLWEQRRSKQNVQLKKQDM
jgi:membrane protein required for colicin V production